MAEPPRGNSAAHLPVADPLALAIDRDHQLAHVVVAVDRKGADIDAYPAAASAPSFQRTFNGSTLHITRVRAGAVSHAQYHRRSVNLWTENPAQVAEDVREAAAEVEAAVVLIAGDPKAIGLLREHLKTVHRPVGWSTSRAAGPTARPSTGCARAWTRRCGRRWWKATRRCSTSSPRSWQVARHCRARGL
ncbi:hypothetical protein GCM10027174_19740 [Salinifilum aidingensis]